MLSAPLNYQHLSGSSVAVDSDAVDEASSSAGPSRTPNLFAACATVCLTAWQGGARQGVLEPLLQEDLYGGMPLPIALDCLSKADILPTTLLLSSTFGQFWAKMSCHKQ